MYRQPSAQVYGITLHRNTCMTFMTFPFEQNVIYNVHDVTPGSTCTSEGLQIPYILVVKFFWFSATIHVTGPVYNKIQSGERNFLTFFHIYNLSLTFTSSLSTPTPSHTHTLPHLHPPTLTSSHPYTLPRSHPPSREGSSWTWSHWPYAGTPPAEGPPESYQTLTPGRILRSQLRCIGCVAPLWIDSSYREK